MQFLAHVWEIRTGKRLRTFDGPHEEYAVVSACCCARCACCGRAGLVWAARRHPGLLLPLATCSLPCCWLPGSAALLLHRAAAPSDAPASALQFCPQGAMARPDRGMRWPAFRWSGGGDAPVLLAHMKANAIRWAAAC